MMKYYLEERIGDPALFTGRKEDLSFFLKKIDDIKLRKTKSMAILAKRKMGKSALMERLYNIIFDKNDMIVPFYYEVKESERWLYDFSIDFFLTFCFQYIAFKSRNRKYLLNIGTNNFKFAINAAKIEGLDYLAEQIHNVEMESQVANPDLMWETARNAPRLLADYHEEFVIQFIDEFQFLNSKVYRDKACTQLIDGLAGSYLNTAESKIAPLLVSGSWVGWLMNDLIMQLPARFKFFYLYNMPEDEAIEMIVKYSQFFEVPISEEVIYQIYKLTEGSPFYISAIIRSECKNKNLTTSDGLVQVMEFETLDDRGEIKSTWMEYVASAFNRVNDRNAKNIVLYLCKHRDRQVTRKELMKELKLDMTDDELEKRLKALVMADIIDPGATYFRYQGIQDNIFDKVFRGVYQEDIESFDPKDVTNEYKEMFEKTNKQYKELQGKYNYQKGLFAEYLIINQLKFKAYKSNEFFKSITNNLPVDFDFVEYETVWSYRVTPEYAKEKQIDIYAKAGGDGCSIIGEVKNREISKFSVDEVELFEKKMVELKKEENLLNVVGFIFSRPGFTKGAEELCLKLNIAYSDDEKWLG